MPLSVDHCTKINNGENSLSDDNKEIAVQYDCPHGYYSPLATMFMNTEGDAIKSIISGFESYGGI